MIFQLIYYYAYSEREVRTEEYRKRIRNLLNVTIRDNTIAGLKTSFLLETNLKNILQSFQYRVPEDISVVDTFEASADYVFAKEKIWTKEFNIKFLFLLYCQYYDLDGDYFEPSDYLNWKEFTEKEKGRILKRLNTFFDEKTGLLQQAFIKECRQLGELYNHNYDIMNIEQDRIYKWIHNKQRELVDEKLEGSEPDEARTLDLKKITEYLNNTMQRNKIFGWKPEDKMDFYIKYSKITAIMHYSGETDIIHEKTVASFVETYGQEALNWFIKNKCLKLSISYDEKGIDRVLTILKKTDYSMRNFSYTADLALAEYTESEQYKSLREKESAIKMHRMNGINEHIYGKIDDFCYKFVVSKAKMKNLTEQECLNELERCGKYKEFYYVEGVLLDKMRAMACIRRRYYAYEFDFELYIKFDPKDIVWVCQEGEYGCW